MKTINRVALSAVMVLVAGCGHEEPSKTAYQAAPPPAPAQAEAPVADVPASAPSVAASTSADMSAQRPSMGNTEAQPVKPPTDGQILQVTHVANLGEIEQAKLALSKTTNPRLRSFAQMVVQDHSQADSRAMVLGKKNNLEREPSPASESLDSDTERVTRMFKAETGADFDNDYADAQIREDQALLETLDQKLIVNATNADLKAYLIQLRAAVASHLRLAQDLPRTLQK